MRTLLLATTNQGKLAEIKPLLEGVSFELMTLAAYPDLVAPEETGHTFAENARAKALYYAAHTGQLTWRRILASSLTPSTASRAWNRRVTEAYLRRIRRSLRASTPRSRRNTPWTARPGLCVPWRSCSGDEVLFEGQGVVEGQVAQAPRGEGGFGYDPIFFYPPFAQTLAEAGDRKSLVSHRGQAFRALRVFLDGMH